MGSPTNTGWKRRSSAASFSTCLRYSSSVVAPMQRSSPRASAGLSMLAASAAPSAAPAPTIVCSSSMNRITWPCASLTSRSTALSRSSNSPRYFAPAIMAPMSSAIKPAILQRLGNVAGDDALREALGDRRLADAGLADQHRVVLGPPREHLDDAPDLLVAADHRIDLALARGVGEIAPELRERLVLRLGIGIGDARAAAHGGERLEQRLAAGAGARAAAWRRGPACRSRARAAGARSRRTRPSARWPRRRRLPGCARWRAPAAPARRRSTFGSFSSSCSTSPWRRVDPDPELLEHGDGAALGLAEQRAQQVRGLDFGVAPGAGQGLGLAQGLLALDGELVEAHGQTKLVTAPAPASGKPAGLRGPRTRGPAVQAHLPACA